MKYTNNLPTVKQFKYKTRLKRDDNVILTSSFHHLHTCRGHNSSTPTLQMICLPLYLCHSQEHFLKKQVSCIKNKATRSPEISRQQFQKLTRHFLYIYIGYGFPLSTMWGNHLPLNFMLKFPISTIWRNHLPFTSKVKSTFQYLQKINFFFKCWK